YTTDFKLSVIEYYLNHYSYHQTAKHFNLNHKTVELWVKLYQAHGIDGIKRRHTKAIYDIETLSLMLFKPYNRANRLPNLPSSLTSQTLPYFQLG
ncbi:helix-turn-helix domain-containing protein, partial [Moraxella lacunata]|uniref:helix-turn-helix domain-containing protein n=1 Tax=Moraxella lacunata TaxID=477 RepID=UPI000ACEA91E